MQKPSTNHKGQIIIGYKEKRNTWLLKIKLFEFNAIGTLIIKFVELLQFELNINNKFIK